MNKYYHVGTWALRRWSAGMHTLRCGDSGENHNNPNGRQQIEIKVEGTIEGGGGLEVCYNEVRFRLLL